MTGGKPIRRDPRLRKLSWDHHRSLVLARRLKNAAGSGDPAAMRAAWNGAVGSFGEELEPHFQVEERWLLPPLRGVGEGVLVERTLADHAGLRSMIAQMSGDLGKRLREFSGALSGHIRFEERTLFEAAQEKLDDDDLDAVARASEMSSSPTCATQPPRSIKNSRR